MLAGFCVIPLGSPEADTASWPAELTMLTASLHGDLGVITQAKGGGPCGGPSAVQGPEVSWDLLSYARCLCFHCWANLGTGPMHKVPAPGLQHLDTIYGFDYYSIFQYLVESKQTTNLLNNKELYLKNPKAEYRQNEL